MGGVFGGIRFFFGLTNFQTFPRGESIPFLIGRYSIGEKSISMFCSNSSWEETKEPPLVREP